MNIFFLQLLTDIKEVSLQELNVRNDIKDCKTERHCPRPSRCMTKLPEDSHFCPFLLFYGLNHVIGYTLLKCSAHVNMTAIPCLPLPDMNRTKAFKKIITENETSVIENPSYNRAFASMAGVRTSTDTMNRSYFATKTLVRIEQPDFACPPYWHQVESMCFTIPHIISKSIGIYSSCSCNAIGSHIHEIHLSPKYGQGSDIMFVNNIDLALDNYLRMFGATFMHDVLVQVNVYKSSIIYRLAPVSSPYISVISECMREISAGTIELCSKNTSKPEISCPHGYFVCKDQTCIVETSRCDGQQDCPEGDDEIGCSEICTHPHPSAKCTQCTIAEGCHCTALYFQCSAGGCVSATAVCDGVTSCADGSDEALCVPKTLMLSCEINQNQNCPMTKEIQSFKQKCLQSETDIHKGSSSHLLQCKDWQCSFMFKCEEAYCIPVHHICDRICNCPNCEDEYECIIEADSIIMSCPGMVKCKKGYPCVHSHHINDGESQCLQTHDDEYNYPVCPVSCSCHGTSVYCKSFINKPVQDFTAISTANNDFASLVSLKQQWIGCVEKCSSVFYFDVSNITDWDLSFVQPIIQNKLNDIHVLNISSNDIGILQYSLLNNLRSIIQLYMQHCNIYSIEPAVFVASSLHIMDLSYNKLTRIDNNVYGVLHNLMHITLRNNYIRSVQLSVFHASNNLTSLDLRNN